jgi:threonine/homoserine/homoserine lactone efflux protein
MSIVFGEKFMNIFAMFLFSMIMSITPGPVNIVTLNSGLNYGFRQTMPYVSGATLGFTLLLLILGMGLSSMIMAYPMMLRFISYIGTAYMFYMGYNIMMSKASLDNQSEVNQAPKFMDGALLQWSNPKAWIACLSGLSTFTSATSMMPLITFVSIYFVICYVCIGLWAAAGMKLKSILTGERYMRWFTQLMGLLLIATSIYMGFTRAC